MLLDLKLPMHVVFLINLEKNAWNVSCLKRKLIHKKTVSYLIYHFAIGPTDWGKELSAKNGKRSLAKSLLHVRGFSLQHVHERLRRLQDLHVRRLSLLDRLVVLVPRLGLADERVVHLLQPVSERRELHREAALLLLVDGNLPVELLALLAEVLDRAHQLIVVVLQGSASAGGGHPWR